MKKLLSLAWLLLCIVLSNTCMAESTLPFYLVNNSHFNDDEVYVALVGKQDGTHIWMDLSTNSSANPAIKNMNTSYNTLHKINGDWGYGNIFTKLSDIKDKTIHIPQISGCRIFFSFKKGLYLHLFDANEGYAGVDLQNPSDPNAGIRWELIEFTSATNGLWINTSRVDAFQYPMGVELFGAEGANNAYMKAGEKLSYTGLMNKWKAQLGGDPDFSACYRDVITFDNIGGIIEQPSKLTSFKENGASKDYFQDYIDRIWSYYSSNVLVCDQGERGVWTGSITNGKMVMTSDFRGGTTACIYGKPNTQEVIEGKGQIASGSEDDKAFQAQFCGALNRGVIDVNVPSGAVQYWGDVNKFFKTDVYNKYVWFFHQTDVSYDGKTYAFAYDDTFDQSATLVTSKASHATISIGGFTTDPSGADDPMTEYVMFSGLAKKMASSTSYTVNVNYQASTDREVHICLYDNTGTWTPLPGGEAYVTVSSGSGVVPVTINLNEAPALGEAYKWKCDLRPIGATWDQALADEVINDISIVDALSLLTDDVAFNNLSTTMISADTYEVDIDYSTPTSRDVVVCLYDNSGTWNVIGETIQTVSAGSGTLHFIVNVDNPPVIGAGYIWKCDIRPVAATWDKFIKDQLIYDISVVSEDENISDTESGSGTTNGLEYTYSFIQTGTSLKVKFTVVNANDFVGLVPVIINKTSGFNEIFSDEYTATYPLGSTVKYACKWMFAGGDATTSDIQYMMQLPTKIDKKTEAMLDIYPNPVSEQLYIGTKNEPSYIIYNMFGVALKQGVGNQIDVSSFLPGMYVVDVENQKLRFIKK